MKAVSKDQYIEYVKANPCVKIADIAEHFGIKKSLVSSHFHYYGLNLKELSGGHWRNYRKCEIVEFAAEHTMKEIIAHFGDYAVLSYINREKIPFLKKIPKPYDGYHREARRDRKTGGTINEMIYILSKHFNMASIGEVFGCSREWVRIICNDFDSGKRVLTDIRKENDGEN